VIEAWRHGVKASGPTSLWCAKLAWLNGQRCLVRAVLKSQDTGDSENDYIQSAEHPAEQMEWVCRGFDVKGVHVLFDATAFADDLTNMVAEATTRPRCRRRWGWLR
jgi:hypothetical protein